MSIDSLPSWAVPILRGPAGKEPVRLEGSQLVSTHGEELGRLESGVLRFPVRQVDDGIAFYRRVGGAHFHERRDVPFAMSALDTPVYHAYLNEVRPADADGIVIDVGGGDGRNARPWLEQGYRRIIVVDPAGEALVRFRARIAAENTEWLDRLLLVEADARALPFATGCARTVLAIEALGCLNEDFEVGLKDCARLLDGGGKMLVAERGYEAALVLRLIYHGIEGMLETANTHSQWDGPADGLVRTRPFTEAELIEAIVAAELKVITVKGIPLLSLLLGWMNGRGMLDGQEKHLPKIGELLGALGHTGAFRRSHVVIAERGDTRR